MLKLLLELVISEHTCISTSGYKWVNKNRFVRVGHALFHLLVVAIFIVELPRIGGFSLEAVSTHTFTSDTDFALFQKQNVVVSGGAGSSAYLSLENRWNFLSISSPQKRYWCAVGIDTTTALVLLSGGRNSNNSGGLNDNWIFEISQNRWTQLSSGGTPPSARYGHILVPISGGKFLSFGGLSSDGYLGDTRIYDSGTNYWSWGNYVVSPSSRAFSSAALDTKRNRVYLFGGENSSGVNNELWYYDISGNSWNYVIQVSTPLGRAAAGLVYLKKSDTLLLFGGHNSSGQRLGDLWHFSIDAATWTQITQQLPKPSARHFHSMIYDDVLDKAVLFGGDAEPSPNIENDLWMYDISSNKWSSAAPLNTPPDGRYGSATGYLRSGINHYLFLFGGTGPLAPGGDSWDETWLYITESSGGFITTSVSVQAPTGVIWKSVSLEPVSQTQDTQRKFQVSVSSDGVTWSSFAGPNGDTNQFFEYAGSPIDIDYLPWRNLQNLKLKFFLTSSAPPVSPSVETILISYNRPPYSPQPQYPSQGKRINRLSPYFSWQRPSDPDSADKIAFYEIQISASSDFSSVYFSSGGILAGDFDTFTSTPGANLFERKWYWRVRASDGNDYGVWSSVYEFYVDTTPPAAVSDFSAVRGLGNGLIYTSFNLPGDDGNSIALSQAQCLLRCATYPILTEEAWAVAEFEKITPIQSLPVGSRMSVDMSGLANATTYYFNVKIVDQAGNCGFLMDVSPSAMTNSPPMVNLNTILGGSVLSGNVEIYWNSSEPDGDEYYLDVYVSSDSGASYFRFNEGAHLNSGTTFYIFNTNRLRNGDFYRLKIIAVDSLGLSTAAVSGVFSIFNPNEPPYDVSITSPAYYESIYGKYIIKWSAKDNNLCDSHLSEIYVSTDGNKSYIKIGESATYYYLFDTVLLENGTGYIIKVKITDDGTPPISAESTPVVFNIKNNNLPPLPFSLKEPPDKKARTALGFYFEWEKADDPNRGDKIFYRLEYSTSPLFEPSYVISAGGLTETRYYPPEPDKMIPTLGGNTTYYWRVYAIDQFGEETLCLDGYREFYLLDRARATSDDNRLVIHALKGLPSNAFVRLLEIRYSEISDDKLYNSIKSADEFTHADPFMKDVNASGEDVIFYVGFYDEAMREISPDGEVEMSVSYDYSEDTGTSPSLRKTHLREFMNKFSKNIRVVTFDADYHRWRPAPSLPLISAQEEKVYSIINSTGYFRFLATLSPQYPSLALSNYPNPFNPDKEKTKIVYTLTSPSDVEIKIYTITGRLVRRFKFLQGTEGARSQPSGYTNEILWDGKNDNGMVVASGVYILEMSTGSDGNNSKLRRKIAVLRR